MQRIPAVNPAYSKGKVKELLDGVQSKLGMVPNLMRTLANSPAGLEGYLSFSAVLARGTLSAKVREQIAVAVAEVNACGYCLSAHTALGKMVRLDSQSILDARHADAADPKTRATLRLAQAIAIQRGDISDADFNAAKRAGLTDADIVEVVANVAVNVLTNYINKVAVTEIDFPEVKPGIEVPAAA